MRSLAPIHVGTAPWGKVAQSFSKGEGGLSDIWTGQSHGTVVKRRQLNFKIQQSQLMS